MYVMPCACGKAWYTTRKNLRRGADRICQDDKGGGCGRELPPPKPEPGHVEDAGLGETLPAHHYWDYSLGACAAFEGDGACRRCGWAEDAHPGQPVHRPPVAYSSRSPESQDNQQGQEPTAAEKLVIQAYESGKKLSVGEWEQLDGFARRCSPAAYTKFLLNSLDEILNAAKAHQAARRKQDEYRSSGMVNLFD